MRSAHRIITAVVASAFVLPLLAVPPASAAVPAAPKAGQCFRYSAAAVAGASGPTRTVPCSSKHTAVIYYVGTVSGAAATAPTPTSAAVAAAAARGCYVSFVRRIGAKAAALTRVSYAFYVPTVAQWAAGARWYRCDAVVFTTSSKLQTIPKNVLAYVKKAAGISAYRRCVTASGRIVACTLPHRFAARKYVVLGSAGTVFPGTAGVGTLAVGACVRKLGSSRIWATWPLADAWAAGQRTATCYARD